MNTAQEVRFEDFFWQAMLMPIMGKGRAIRAAPANGWYAQRDSNP